MEYLSNAFSVLGLEDGDSPSSLASTSDAGTSNSNGKSSSDKLAAENGNNKDEKLSAPASEFRLPLVWIDLEMTGLNIEVDRIVEIACIITDGSLSKSVEGPDLVIHQSQECLDRMNEWCQNHHAASGLTKEVLESTVSESEAEKQPEAPWRKILHSLQGDVKVHVNQGLRGMQEDVISFVKKHVGTTHRPLLAGNSIYVDFIFLKKYMPDLASIFSHVLVDVSTIKALCIRWYPRAHKKAPAKEQKHRAREDIRESIMELKYFRENIFIKPPKK